MLKRFSGQVRNQPAGGRSGNDFLQQGGQGYESWGAEGPSGASASGGSSVDTWRGAPATRSRLRADGSMHGRSGDLPMLAGAIGAGAALMFFLDPDRGARRRNMVRDQLASMMRTAAGMLRDRAVDGGNRARGIVAEVRGRMNDGDVSDEQLVARVRSELGHHVERVRPIEVSAEHGSVVLSGAVPADQVPTIVAIVGKVRGVTQVENRLSGT